MGRGLTRCVDEKERKMEVWMLSGWWVEEGGQAGVDAERLDG